MKNYTIFKNSYVLIEDGKNKMQPFYKEFTKDIPTIDLQSPILCCPFSSARRSPKQKSKKSTVKAGYCEVCYIKYDNYNVHVDSKEHREYAEDDYNYRMIDIVIKQMLETELYNGFSFMQSPCEKLEAEFANHKTHVYNNDSQSDSLIRLSLGSKDDNNDVVDFDIILNKIERKYSQSK